MAGIEVRGLVKTFQVREPAVGRFGALRQLLAPRHRTVRALDGISFTIAPGEIVGYIGPNGAGKSTTIKIMSGILVPDSGECVVMGRTPWADRVAHVRGIGVVFGQRTQLWWDLPVRDSFDLLRDMYRVNPAEHIRTRDALITSLGLEPLLGVPVRQLSLGQRMRCDLAAALLHRPAVVFLDEPTIGLDPEAKLAFRDLIRGIHRDHGVTVILTTHDMDDIEALCRRVILIADGRILADGSLDDLRNRFGRERLLTVDLEDEGATVADSEATVISRDGHRVRLKFDPARTTAAALIGRLTAMTAVRDLTVEHPPIEDVVARIYRERNG